MSAIKIERLGDEQSNYQGCLMRVIQYGNASNVIVEFQDEYRAIVNTNYDNFNKGKVKNPYYPSVYNVGAIGTKYPSKKDGIMTKEYTTWRNMLMRCFDEKYKSNHPAYRDVTCCNEWLLFENFCDWLHSQSNYNIWYSGERWCLDKDILVKGNKVYSPDVCCLVPDNVNLLFIKKEKLKLPIGVHKNGNGYAARCDNSFTKETKSLGTYKTIGEAFYAYKIYKENLIKEVAKLEYLSGNIVESCYKSMMEYVVEIDD